MDFPVELIERLRRSRHCVVFSGAGMSAESGIATFRDAMTGLWGRFSAEQLATPAAFAADPPLVWGWYEWRRQQVAAAQPNAGHRAVAGLAARIPQVTLITQNVDDLHERAGSADVIHLHGSLFTPRCEECSEPYAFPAEQEQEPDGGRRLPPPRCACCGGNVRPGVVWFGEGLPEEAWTRAVWAVEGGGDQTACDLLFSIGTSSLVYPAAELPFSAVRKGACVVQVNPQPTALDGTAHFSLRGPAAVVLPALFEAAWPEEVSSR